MLDLRTLPVLVLSYWPGNPYHPPRFRQRSKLSTVKSVFFTHSETKLKYTLNLHKSYHQVSAIDSWYHLQFNTEASLVMAAVVALTMSKPSCGLYKDIQVYIMHKLYSLHYVLNTSFRSTSE